MASTFQHLASATLFVSSSLVFLLAAWMSSFWTLISSLAISYSKRQTFFLYLAFLLAYRDKSKINPSLFWVHFWHSSHTCQSVNTYKRPDTYNVQRQTRATPIEIKVDTQVQSQEVAMNEWKKNNLLTIILDLTNK